MPERKVEPERIVLSDDTMARRWKFILDEACVAKTGPDMGVLAIGFALILALILAALTVVACVVLKT